MAEAYSEAGLTLLQQYRLRKTALFVELESWLDQYREISRYLLPRTGRFLVDDGKQNKGDKRHNDIYDSTGTHAHTILSAGLMSGATSPARSWFRLALQDKDLMEFEPVKMWLHKVTLLMREIFNKSNTYRSFHQMYAELGAYGTAASFVLPNYKTVLHHYPMTVGEYAIATDPEGNVNTLVREINKTVGQVVAEFIRKSDGTLDWTRCSSTLKNMWDRHDYDKWVPITHIVEPRSDRERNLKSKLATDMPWASCYFESKNTDEIFLRKSGFKRFPAVVPRWDVSGGDIYGNSPGMAALGDIKQLQHGQFRKAQGIDYLTKPPLQAPASLKEHGASMLPGGLTYHDMAQPNAKISPLWESRIDLSHLLGDIQDVRERIRQAFFADLFMMIANIERSNVTATEIAEKHEEKLLMLGPVLERLHNEMLMPKIDITFEYMLEADILPAPPEELQETELNVEFVSVLAQAQRAVGVQSVDRLINTVGSIATLKQDPGAWDKLDTDQITDAYGDMLGVDPQFIVADKKVALIREQRAKRQAEMQQAAVAEQMAGTAQKLGSTPTGEDNMLSDLMNQFQGYSIPS